MKTIYNIYKDGQLFTKKAFDNLGEAKQYIDEMINSLFPVLGLEAVEEQVEECDWRNYVGDSYYLYYVDYRDDLNEHFKELNACIQKNEIYPLSEKLDEWWECPESYELGQIREKMTEDGFEEEFEAHEDEIREWLWEHDKSEPIKDLLRNTTTLALYYDLGYNADGWHEAFLCNPWRNTSEKQEVANIRRILGIKKGSPEDKVLAEIVANASYGGNLRIYFPMDDFFSMLTYDNDNDFQTIRFDGKFPVGIIDTVQGSGWYEEIEIHKEFPFKRENLIFSKCDHYSLESIYGHYDNWAKEYPMPTFLKRKSTSKRTLKESESAKELKRQAEYEATFKAGGCTLGDTDIRRHRDVYYDNNVPCGHHCPHCGQFWID